MLVNSAARCKKTRKIGDHKALISGPDFFLDAKPRVISGGGGGGFLLKRVLILYTSQKQLTNGGGVETGKLHKAYQLSC